jgi:hypothetical protein
MATDKKRGGLQTYANFTPPSPYEMERRKAEQMRRYAELLQEQAMAEDEPFTYQGIRAMPSPAAALGKLLKAYGSKKAAEKADEAEQRAREADIEGAERLRRELAPETRIAAPTGAEIAGTMGTPQINEEGQLSYGPSVQAPLRTEMVGPTAKERQNIFANYAVTGTPTAQRLAQVLASQEPKTQTMEFGDQLLNVTDGQATPVMMDGKAVTASPKPAAGSSLSKLIAERDALPPNSPLRQTYDAAIFKETNNAPLIGKLDLGDKGSAKAQEIFLADLGAMRPRAYAATNIIRAVNNLDRLTQKGTYTGSLAPNAVGAGQFLNSIGIKIDPKTLQNTEAFSAQVSDLVMSAQAALGGARGFTKEETAILMQMFPQIINSPEARVTIGNIIRNKQLEVIDEYDSLINDYKETYKDSRIPYKPIDDEEVRYQRWKRSQGGR